MSQLVESILKSPTSTRRSLCRVTFNLKLDTDLRPILKDFVSGTSSKAYNELVATLNDPTVNSTSQKISMLQSSCSVVGLLDQGMHRLVLALLNMEWLKESTELVQVYQKFVLELLAAHNYYTRSVMERLFTIFKDSTGSGGEPYCEVDPPQEVEMMYNQVHELIDRIVKIIPMAESVLMSVATSRFPYMSRSALEHQTYVYNLFKISSYRPNLRQDILALVISKMVTLDVQIPREVLEDSLEDAEEDDEMEVEVDDTATVFTMDDLPSVSQYSHTTSMTEGRDMQLPIVKNLDVLMEQLFVFVQRQCELDKAPSSWQHHRQIYKDLWAIFEKQLLLTHGSHHVQFVMFYLCSLRPPTLVEHFLGSLWTRVTQPGETSVSRQSAACYVASLLARACYVTPRIVRSFLAQMAGWCHAYIAAQQDSTSCDVRQHPVFYTVCQGLFYVVAFRHADLVNTNKGLMWTQSLGLGKLVTSRLNPLKPCLPGVAQNFAAVTRTYQLAYCYTVLERNSRTALPCVSQHSGQPLGTRLSTFFPFDPYLLSRSARFISEEYRQYEALEQPAGPAGVDSNGVKTGSDGEEHEETEGESEDEEEVYDIKATSGKGSMSPGSLRQLISPSSFPDMFNYGTSPGFKHL